MKRPLTIWCLVAASLVCVVAWADLVLVLKGSLPNLPTSTPSATRPSNWNATADYTVTNKATWDSAIAAVQPGEVIEIDADATGLEELDIASTVKGASDNWIIIRTDEYASLPAAGTGVSTTHVTNMPSIYTDAINTSDRALDIQPSSDQSGGAAYIWIIGMCIESTSTAGTAGTHTSNLVTMGVSGGGTVSNAADLCDNIALDQCIIRGTTTSPINTVVRVDCNNFRMLDCYEYQCQGDQSDGARGIEIYSGGPMLIQNNYVSASGINLMFGGNTATPSVPHDITVQNNHFHKDAASWEGVWLQKNLHESKNSTRVLIQNNVFEGGWDDVANGGQPCSAYYAKNSDSGETTTHQTFRRNLVKDGHYAFRFAKPIAGSDAPSNILVEQNLYFNMDETGEFSGCNNVTFRNLTISANGGSRSPDMKAATGLNGLTSIDNIWDTPVTHWRKDGVGGGTDSLNSAYTGTYSITYDLYRGATISLYNTGAEAGSTAENNSAPADTTAIGFVGGATPTVAADYELDSGSSYAAASSTGGKPGCDVPTLLTTWTSGVER